MSTVVRPNLPVTTMGVRNARELRTLAESLDLLGAGSLARAADLLAQRFIAIETAIMDGSWESARHLELIPPEPFGLATRTLRSAAHREEARARKLARAPAGRGAG